MPAGARQPDDPVKITPELSGRTTLFSKPERPITVTLSHISRYVNERSAFWPAIRVVPQRITAFVSFRRQGLFVSVGRRKVYGLSLQRVCCVLCRHPCPAFILASILICQIICCFFFFFVSLPANYSAHWYLSGSVKWLQKNSNGPDKP